MRRLFPFTRRLLIQPPLPSLSRQFPRRLLATTGRRLRPSATLPPLFSPSAANADADADADADAEADAEAEAEADGNKMEDLCAAHDGLSQLDSFSLYLRQRNIDKWGLVVYRCSYKNDAVWARIKEVIKSRILKSISKGNRGGENGEEHSAPCNIAETMDWTFVEDQASLDGISTHDLRARFLAQRREEFSREQLRAQDAVPSSLAQDTFESEARYNFFIKIDQDVLQQAVNEGIEDCSVDDESRLYSVFVNIVNANWTPEQEEQPERDPDTGSDQFAPLEGFTHEHVGWYRASVNKLDLEFYENLSAIDLTSMWYIDYQRPPEIVYG
ncbi:hypothetical protein VFPPC_13778 [Pochonia chlamydosporia 170]|uniref:Uncharacterized protein n=1 Tax=Pochonia chlamydosporia 170 TaxID=1380566 RepID=A0A179FUZ2_METCM|nr:hypothetical protein VFPPC_13778 [Pochonia chlamydosporia 170]OAQ69058.1 hypothetical protein VFPPC_13778 [Pochonia chlamydosporia 170]